ncbi:MAG: Hpt domain-containing protein, partial [Gammaproteobacteria bacterium]|nr:Hpt domain-containing protein [Gammaproteobacteria bacterium]
MDKALLTLLLETFAIDLDEQVDMLTNDLLLLEKSPADDESRAEAYAGIMRSAHNLKGAARGLGLTDIVEASHRMETMFGQLRDNGTSPSRSFVDLCEQCFEQMKAIVKALRNDAEPPNLILELLEQLAAAADDISAEPVSADPVPPAESVNNKDVESSEAEILQAQAKPETKPEPSSPTVSTDSDKLPAEPTHSPKSAASTDVIRINTDKLDRLSALSDELLVNRTGLTSDYLAIRQLRARFGSISKQWKHSITDNNSKNKHWTAETASQMLDEIMTELGEFEQETSEIVSYMRRSVNEMGRLTTSLNHNIRLLRLVPA